ncbi:MAG: hypothetical protein NTV89_07980 [Proteobacteria bacterium]|nr:hypothetical protein [Pseudomonadota bacterium]
MFSDNHRYIKIFLLVLILVLLCLYSYRESKSIYIDLGMCLANAGQFDGKEILLENYVYVSSVSKDRFEIEQEGKKIFVVGTAEGLAPGDEIAIRAVFHRQGYMTLQELHINKLRNIKIIISLAAALFVAGLFLIRYRFTLNGFQFVERASCRT